MFDRLKTLFRHTTVYGLGDVATSVVSFLLLPVFTRFLGPVEYGVLALLVAVEAVSKTTFRFGLDASFMRLHYDVEGESGTQQLTSTVFVTLLALTAPLLAIGLLAAPWLARHLLGIPEHADVLRLVLVNTFVIGFYFLPFHLLRIQQRSQHFAVLTFARSTATLVLRLVFVAVMELGILGVVLADLAVTAVFGMVVWRLVSHLIRPRFFSFSLCREAVRLGLPRIPNGLAHQVIAVSDRYLLTTLATIQDVGVYAIGAAVGTALKLFVSAFQAVWLPFVFETMREPDAKYVFRRLTTYVFGVLVLLCLALSVVAADLIRLMTTPAFYPAATVVPFIAIGVVLHGLHQLTSIGVGIAKRPVYGAVATATAASASVASNIVLIPLFGFVGAGMAYALSYAVLLSTALVFSLRYYPIPHEWSRLARIAVAGFTSYGLVIVLTANIEPPIVGMVGRVSLACLAYPIILFMVGFFRTGELQHMRGVVARFTRRRPDVPVRPPTEPDDGIRDPGAP